MQKKSQWLLLSIMLAFALLASLSVASGGGARAQESTGPVVSEKVTPYLSPAARDLVGVQAAQSNAGAHVQIHPRRTNGRGPAPAATTQTDPVVQAQASRDTAMTPPPLQNFAGMTGQEIGANWTPPDVAGDVGPNHYVQMVNSHLAIYDKAGTVLAGPIPINQFWRGIDDPCGRNNDGDPIVLYDPLADRWLLSQFAHSEGPPYYECIAISRTPDPAGAYYLYSFNVGKNFPDYPKLGVWPDAYYMTTNSDSFEAFAFDRGQMLQGQPGTFQRFSAFDNFMLPADLDGPAPPAGAPNYFYTMNGANQIKMWAFAVDFANPANSSFTRLPDLAAAPYNYTLGDLIPQRGTGQMLDSIAEWPMWRFVYRNFGAYETLLGNFAVDVDGNGHIGIRWFELRKVGNGNWQIFQQGTYAPDADHRWMGSIAMDGAGNIALGYSVSGPNLFPSIRYATRARDDAPGLLQPEQTLVAGGASQTRDNRWGDYSSMSVDPADDATFWFTTEYYAAGDEIWRTRIGSFQVAAPATPSLVITKRVTMTRTPVPRGDRITYTVEVRNLGDGDANAVQVLDTLPDHLAGADLDQTVTISAGQSALFTVPAVLSDTAPYNATITNTASFSHTSGRGQASAAILVEPVPAMPSLVITKRVTMTRTPVPRGDRITYTVEVRNLGDGDASAVQVLDVLSDHLAGADLNQTVTISAGQSALFTVPAVLSDTAPYNATITNTATFSHTSGRGQASAVILVEPVPAMPSLVITKRVTMTRTPVPRGDRITYTVEVHNLGDGDANAVQVLDALPDHLAGADLNQTVTISAGQSALFTVPAVLSDTAPYNATITNTATFSHTSGRGQASAVILVEPAPAAVLLPNLISTFTLSPTVPRANQEVLVTLQVTNTGAVTADSFYVDFYINPVRVPVTATDWIALADEEIVQGIEWEVESLAAGQSITLTSDGSQGGQAPDPLFTYWNGYLPAGAQDLYSYADAFNYGDPNGTVSESNEQDNRFYRGLTPLTPTLEIALDAPATVPFQGDLVYIDYTVAVTNHSELSLTNVIVRARVPAGTAFVDADNNGFEQEGMVTWQLAQLDPKQSISLQMLVVVLRIYSLDSAETAAVRASVLGGITATVAAWPWQAAILDPAAPDDFTGQYCGGTLIADEWVLTAASCVDGYRASELAVVLGRQRLTSNAGQRVAIAEVVVHPDYDLIQKGIAKNAIYIDVNDIALLRLATPATRTEHVFPVPLLTPAGASLVVSGTRAVVTGWGNRSGANDGSDFPDALHEVEVPIVSNAACQNAYAGQFTVTEGMVCAGLAQGGIDFCAGDEGGPLVVQDSNGAWVQAGIASFNYGRGCGKENQYGVYTRVSAYIEWIASALNTITNGEYRVTTGQGFRAEGEFILKTTVLQEEQETIHLPYLAR